MATTGVSGVVSDVNRSGLVSSSAVLKSTTRGFSPKRRKEHSHAKLVVGHVALAQRLAEFQGRQHRLERCILVIERLPLLLGHGLAERFFHAQ